jgi:hypothetical protein
VLLVTNIKMYSFTFTVYFKNIFEIKSETNLESMIRFISTYLKSDKIMFLNVLKNGKTFSFIFIF